MYRLVAAALLAGVLLAVTPAGVQAQPPAYAPSGISYFAPPPANGVYLPASFDVTRYYYPRPMNYYHIPTPWVSHYHPSAAVVAPIRVHYGLFGRTYIRSQSYSFGYSVGKYQ